MRSAGGNLAALVTHHLRGKLQFQVLVYPSCDLLFSSESCQKYGAGFGLSAKLCDWYDVRWQTAWS